MKKNLINRSTSLSENIISFCRFLRTKGFAVSPDHETDALRAMSMVPFHSKNDLRLSLNLTLSKNKQQFKDFNALFDHYWKELNKAVDSKVKERKQENKTANNPPSKPKRPSFASLKNWLHGKQEKELLEAANYSDQRGLSTKDFSSFNDDELWDLKKEIKKIAKSIVNKRTRRFQPTHQHVQPDIRRIIRNNLRSGGEVMDLYYKKKKDAALNLVLLCDVSKSMALYSRFLIQFLYAFQSVFNSIKTFVFSSSITNISSHLKDSKYEDALNKLVQNMNHWSDGTKIGSCLQEFELEYSKQMINNNSVIVVVSDGLDTGDLEVLEQSMARLCDISGKIVWLNPLAGSPDYKPEVGGMKAALPYIDVLAPIHNLESLKNLPKHLLGIRQRKNRHRYYHHRRP